MPSRRTFLLAAMAWRSSSALQSAPAEFTVDAPHPRLLLPARRLRLLRREKERGSMRWAQFQAVMQGERSLPEPGFAHALYYLAGGDAEHGRRAIRWATEQGNDLRQLALVFDWCQDLLNPDEKNNLAARLESELKKERGACGLESKGEKPAGAVAGSHGSAAGSCDIAAIRSRLLAAVALSQHAEGFADQELQFVVRQWWSESVIPALKRGESPIGRQETYPLMELLHVVRDNVGVDLREEYKAYFSVLPLYHLLTYYPGAYPGPANEVRIPLITDGSEPDLAVAALSRAAELSMVAYDANALEVQFLQGWCMQDRFLMRDAFGIPYEFLWANPYHPGLSYYNAPLLYHDPERGRLVVREHWDDGAKWFYYQKGVMQTFGEGKIKPLGWSDLREPVPFGAATVWPMRGSVKFRVETEDPRHYFLIGLEADQKYDLEVDDEEIYEKKADAGGIIVVEAPANRKAGARLRKASASLT